MLNKKNNAITFLFITLKFVNSFSFISSKSLYELKNLKRITISFTTMYFCHCYHNTFYLTSFGQNVVKYVLPNKQIFCWSAFFVFLTSEISRKLIHLCQENKSFSDRKKTILQIKTTMIFCWTFFHRKQNFSSRSKNPICTDLQSGVDDYYYLNFK